MGLRVALTVVALGAVLPRGLEYACLAVVGGSCLAEVGSFLLLFLQFLRDRRRHPTPPRGKERALSPLCRIALPTAAAAWCRSGLLTAEHLLIPAALAMGAFSREEALSTYAALHGMALPVVLWPTAVLSSFASLLVPLVASRHAAGKKEAVLSATVKALTLAALFSFASATVLFVTADGLGEGIYGSPAVVHAIRMLAPLVPVMYMDSVTDALLKGMGRQVYSMGVNIADAASAILLVLLLLPRFGGEGYLWVIWATEILNFALSFSKLCRLVRPGKRVALPFLLLGLSAAAAVALTSFALPPCQAAGAWAMRGAFALLAFSLPALFAARLTAPKRDQYPSPARCLVERA
jgi:stage V sporulation protein B